MNEIRISETRCVQYEIRLAIKAQWQTVWAGLTQQLNVWWLPGFRMLGPGSCLQLETHAGGKLFEKNGNAELLWYNVLSIMPSESINLVGYCTAEYGGPSTSLLTLRLSPGESETLLTIQDSLTGYVSDSHAESLRNGWIRLFSDGLKAWCEGLQNINSSPQTC